MATFSLTFFLIATASAFLGGFIDAIAGGGGLIVLPTMLLLGLPPHQALSVNKLSACLGTASALGTFARSGLVHWRIALLGVPFSLLGAHIGSVCTSLLDPQILGKVLVLLLPVAFLFSFLSPTKASPKKEQPTTTWWKVALICFLLGTYDGFFGPGTGSFLILAFHLLLALDLLHASATAKVLNLASNLASTITFILLGTMIWSLAIPMALASITGNVLGSSFAIHSGSRLVKRFLHVSLTLLLLTLLWKYFFS